MAIGSANPVYIRICGKRTYNLCTNAIWSMEPTNRRLPINDLPYETPSKIKDENDVKIVREKNT